MNRKYIETITFDEIINQALEKKEEIAEDFLDKIESYKHEYSYYTLIVDFRQETFNDDLYLDFMVDNEVDNAYTTGFNLRLFTLCISEYSKDELTKELVIKLLEKDLQKLKKITTPKK